METLLTLLKADLRILSDIEDIYLTALLECAIKDITDMGIILDTADIGDSMLAVDYAAWKYKKRDEGVGLPKHLKHRLHTRLFNEKGRVSGDAGTA